MAFHSSSLAIGITRDGKPVARVSRSGGRRGEA